MSRRVAAHIRSNVVGYVAVFIALSGTAWALETNSVKSKHIKDGQVKSVDVADDGVTGVDVAEDTLAKVPQASTADNAQAAEQADNAALLDNLDSSVLARKGSESWHEIAPQPGTANDNNPPSDQFICYAVTAGSPPCTLGWQNYDDGVNFNSAASYRDAFGVVHLKGLVKGFCSGCGPSGFDAGTYGTIFVLPDGFRPARQNVFGVASKGTDNDPALGRIDVEPNGFVTVTQSRLVEISGHWFSLDGITFRCAPSGQNGCP